jgi:hypothetical protein
MRSGASGPSARRDSLPQVVRDVVAQTAPEELPVVAGLSDVNEHEVIRRLAHSRRGDDPLGFGMAETVVLVTPVVWIAVHEVVTRMTDAATDSIGHRIRAAARRMLHRKEPPAPPLPRFGPAELAEVRRRVLQLARESGLKPNRAELLADRVVGRLALNGTADEDE